MGVNGNGGERAGTMPAAKWQGGELPRVRDSCRIGAAASSRSSHRADGERGAVPRFNEQRVTDFLLGNQSPGDGAKLWGTRPAVAALWGGVGGGDREGRKLRGESRGGYGGRGGGALQWATKRCAQRTTNSEQLAMAFGWGSAGQARGYLRCASVKNDQ